MKYSELPLIDVVCEHYDIDPTELDTKSRKHPLPIVKGIYYNWLYRAGKTYKGIGEMFGIQNHTTILSSCNTARDQENNFIREHMTSFVREYADEFVRNVISEEVFTDKFLYTAMDIDRSSLHRKKNDGNKFKVAEANKLWNAMKERGNLITKLYKEYNS